jgi:molybdopterin/thiamine biosynthesis adenylyltransferase
MSHAIETRSGLAFIHSHPGAMHPPSLSNLDLQTSRVWARSIVPAIDAPMASLVWSKAGVVGLVFDVDDPENPIQIDRVVTAGQGQFSMLQPAILSTPTDLDDRQRRALSALGNDRIRDLSVGLVGAGGTGSPVADILGRMGVKQIVVVDPDVIDTESNLRRIVGSQPTDFSFHTGKAAVIKRHLREVSPDVDVVAVKSDVREEGVARTLLDCDVIFATTDTHSSRALVNQLAVQYWIPTIDVGVRVGTTKVGSISGMPVEIRTLLPDTPCLWCIKALSSDVIYAENLPPSERERLFAEGYVQGLPEPQPSLAAVNYLAAALAVTTALRLLSGDRLPDTDFIVDAWEQYWHPVRRDVRPDCVCSNWRGRADTEFIAFIPTTT